MGSYMRHVFLGDPMFFDTLLLTDVELPRSASWTLASTTPPSEKKKNSDYLLWCENKEPRIGYFFSWGVAGPNQDS